MRQPVNHTQHNSGKVAEPAQGSEPVHKVNPGRTVSDLPGSESAELSFTEMRMPESPFVQRKCHHCEEEDLQARTKPMPGGLKPFIQTSQNGGNRQAAGSLQTAGEAVSNQILSMQGTGSVIPETTKSFMESRFGADFSDVRIHAGGEAARLSGELNAQAFTVGKDIYFNEGKFSPESAEGKHLLAHELTHTLQQNGRIDQKIRKATAVTYSPVHKDEATLTGETFEQDINFHYTENNGSDFFETDKVSIYVPSRVRTANPAPATPPGGGMGGAGSSGAGAPAEIRRSVDKVPPTSKPTAPPPRPTGPVNVMVFFTANTSTGQGFNDTLTHGLRKGAEGSDIVLITLPSPDDTDTPNYRPFSTADIMTCLVAANLPGNIGELRLAAHSRGHRGLTRTLMGNVNKGDKNPKERDPKTATIRTPLVDVSKVTGITYYDDYFDSSQRIVKHLEQPVSAGGAGLSKDALHVFHITDGVSVDSTLVNNVHDQAYSFDGASMGCVASLGCLRLIEDSAVLDPAIRTALTQPKYKAVSDQLTANPLPARGTFTRKSPAPAGKQRMVDFCANRRLNPGVLISFINEKNLAKATPPGDSFQWDLKLAAHHFFVYEFSSELFDPLPSAPSSTSQAPPGAIQRKAMAGQAKFAPGQNQQQNAGQKLIQRSPGWSDAAKTGASSSVVTAPSGGGWNDAEHLVGNIRRIPIEGLKEGNQDASPDKAASESASGKAIVLIPSTPIDPSKPVDVLLHLHGYYTGYRQNTGTPQQNRTNPKVKTSPGNVLDVEQYKIEQQMEAHLALPGSRQMIGVLPQGTTTSGFGAGGFDAEAYLTEVFAQLFPPPQKTPARGRIVLSAHSGGGNTLQDLLPGNVNKSKLPKEMTGPDRTGELALFDAINGPKELKAVTDWMLAQLDFDKSNLLAKTNEADKLAYLTGSMRFIATYTNSSYTDRHVALNASKNIWFSTNAAALGGTWDRAHNRPGVASPGSLLQLFDHYQVNAAGHSNHDAIMNINSPLEKALNKL